MWKTATNTEVWEGIAEVATEQVVTCIPQTYCYPPELYREAPIDMIVALVIGHPPVRSRARDEWQGAYDEAVAIVEHGHLSPALKSVFVLSCFRLMLAQYAHPVASPVCAVRSLLLMKSLPPWQATEGQLTVASSATLRSGKALGSRMTTA